MKNRKALLGVVIAVILVVALVSLWPRRSRLLLTGIVTTDDVIVSSEIGGRLQRLAVKEGQTVQAGQTVAVIQPPEYAADVDYYEHAAQQSQAQIAQAKADLAFQQAESVSTIAQAQSNLSAARAQAKAAGADRENAQLAFERARELRAKGTNSISEYDSARTSHDAADARARAADEQAAAAESALHLAQAESDQVAARQAALQASVDGAAAAAAQAEKARVRLGYTEIKAPISGVVDVRAARQGEVVNPGQAIITVINPDDLWVRVDVEESYIENVRLGDKLDVRFPSGDHREGTVFYRAVDADYATQRDVSRTKRDIRTFELRLRCDNRDRRLAVGLTAYVTLPVGPVP